MLEGVQQRIRETIVSQEGRAGFTSRLRRRAAIGAAFSLFFYDRLRHWGEPYGKWMRVEVPENLPGKDVLPSYYRIPFHGQPNGYLSRLSAVMYDRGVSFVFGGRDEQMRAELLRDIQGSPARIVDIASGTGVSTFHLARRFPDAEVVGVELSPFFIDYAREQAAKQGLRNVTFIQAQGEETGLEKDSFDLVASTFLFHEVPVPFIKKIVAEMHRLAKHGAQFAITDAAQLVDNPQADRFQAYLYEPYFKAYARMDWPSILFEAGFESVHQRPVYTFALPMSKIVTAWKPEKKTKKKPQSVARKSKKAHGAGPKAKRARKTGKKKAVTAATR